MDARGQRALARRNRRDAVEKVLAAPREENLLESDTEGSEILEEREQVPLRIRIPGRVGPPAAEVPAAIDPGMWFNIVNVKPPHLIDLEVESVKSFILDFQRYSQKCPRQLPQKMQQFNLFLEEQLEVICDEDGRDYEDVVELEKEKSDLSLNTYVQYVEDFKFWVMAALNANRLPRTRS